ncbi:MAG: hypothetical protein EB029_04905 [Actinobacteria bacterium]|jgi:hypothetical protein|nr:hypothetical protein [Actinomycetota bacterium]NDC13347.1 hypothetical protein [Actinomycetota bacterium]NDE51563.1 hypothetical protein [Actinomycetota bacterium]
MTKKYKVGDQIRLRSGEKWTLGPDVDLEKEIVLLEDGIRLTDKKVAEIVEGVHRREAQKVLKSKRR